jgi:hypothetical protein
MHFYYLTFFILEVWSKVFGNPESDFKKGLKEQSKSLIVASWNVGHRVSFWHWR